MLTLLLTYVSLRKLDFCHHFSLNIMLLEEACVRSPTMARSLILWLGYPLVTVHKWRPHSAREGACPVQKFFGFFESYGVSALTRGFEPVRTRWGKGSIFCDFVRTSFMDGPLPILFHLLITVYYFHFSVSAL